MKLELDQLSPLINLIPSFKSIWLQILLWNSYNLFYYSARVSKQKKRNHRSFMVKL